MSGEASFNLSQDYKLITPKTKNAYPIFVEEWEYLKTKITAIADESNWFHTIGSIALGVSGSTFLTILTITLPESDKTTYIMLWALFGISLFGGILSLFFSYSQNKYKETRKEEIIEQMNIIEKRFSEGQT